MNRPTREMRTNTRRAEIVDAALSCFVRLGYQATTVADIRRASGASTGSIYHHFGSKERLAAAVYLEGIRAYQRGFVAVVDAHPGARSGVEAMIRYHVEWVEANRDWTRFLLRMRHSAFMAEVEEAFADLNRAFFEALTAWLDRQVEAGRVRRIPPTLFVAILLGPCQEYVRLRFAGAPTTDTGSAIRTLGAAAWRSLAAAGRK